MALIKPRKVSQGQIDPTTGLVTRIAGDKLQRLRKAHFQANPLCVKCLEKGRGRPATELDHIVALVNGGTNDPENFQGLCQWHHLEKTRIDLGWKPKPKIGVDGWPENFA